MTPNPFAYVKPWPRPKKEECVFYHSITYPDGEQVESAWDIRDYFDSYIGGYPVKGKTLLDVGTASGFLTFHAEKVGAIVTSLDAGSGREINHIPLANLPYFSDRRAFIEANDHYLKLLKNSYWYGWYKFNSNARVAYIPIADLPLWEQKFDVVLAGAIVEHMSDPVTMIGNITSRAKEAVIIAFTFVDDTDELKLTAAPNWAHNTAENSYTWWVLSRGLYQKIFDNLGFDVEFVDSKAIGRYAKHTAPTTKKTIIARKRG